MSSQHRPAGKHLLADLHGVAAPLLQDAERMEALLREAAQAAGAIVLHSHFHSFGPGQGVTGVVLLAESHLALHTWPELGSVTLDVYVCNLGTDNSARAHALLEALLAAFAPARAQRHALQRGRAIDIGRA